jgi:hypothetical protein
LSTLRDPTLYVRWRQVRGADKIAANVYRIVVNTFLGERRRPWGRVRLTGDRVLWRCTG